jgi:two-component system nitrate/nitrite response regulator NarL
VVATRFSSSDHLNHTTQITRREREIVALIAEGLSYEEIAHKLRVGTHKIRRYVRGILGKLGLRTRLEIAAYARRNGSRGSGEE